MDAGTPSYEDETAEPGARRDSEPHNIAVLDSTVVGHLQEFGLVAFQDRLTGLGVKCSEDIGVLEDRDLLSIGMTLVEVRKLRLCHASGPHQMASSFWERQRKSRPMRVIFVRHGQSEANVKRDITRTVPDHQLHLTEKGRQDALAAGIRLKSIIGDETVKFVVSPYVRTVETSKGLLRAWGDKKPTAKTDVRIREMEYGNYDSDDIQELHQVKKQFGVFYFRFPDGESPADCYDRASSFLESLYRSWEDNEEENEVFVGHGMMILVTLMRLLRLSVDEWEEIDALKNCEFVVLERTTEDPKYHIAYTWAEGEEKLFGGLRKKKKDMNPLPVWNGDPDAELLTSTP